MGRPPLHLGGLSQYLGGCVSEEQLIGKIVFRVLAAARIRAGKLGRLVKQHEKQIKRRADTGRTAPAGAEREGARGGAAGCRCCGLHERRADAARHDDDGRRHGEQLTEGTTHGPCGGPNAASSETAVDSSTPESVAPAVEESAPQSAPETTEESEPAESETVSDPPRRRKRTRRAAAGRRSARGLHAAVYVPRRRERLYRHGLGAGRGL